MKFTEFFWDFDGTLFNTYPRMNRAFMKSLNDLGITVDMETLIKLTKVTLGHAATVLAPGREKEVMHGYHKHSSDEGLETMIPYEGAKRMLESVCEHGGRNYLYTHSGHITIDALKACGMDHLFTDFVTRDNGFKAKPAPDALLYLLNKHALDPATCVMVGDRDIDLLAGKNAGISGAMYDPDGFYPDYDTPYSYTTFFDMMADLIWEQHARDLHVSDMFCIQQMLQARHPEWGGLHPERAKSQLLWMLGEVGEVIDVLKKAKLDAIEHDPQLRQRFIEEMVDVAMYLNEVAMCMGVTSEEFSAAYFQKHQHNMQRNWITEIKDRYGC